MKSCAGGWDTPTSLGRPIRKDPGKLNIQERWVRCTRKARGPDSLSSSPVSLCLHTHAPFIILDRWEPPGFKHHLPGLSPASLLVWVGVENGENIRPCQAAQDSLRTPIQLLLEAQFEVSLRPQEIPSPLASPQEFYKKNLSHHLTLNILLLEEEFQETGLPWWLRW